MSSAMDAMLSFNERFVTNKEYDQYGADRLPDKKLAILTCMDTRLTRLLPAALDLQNGDVKLIKNAGGIISHPFGSAMRSLLISVYFMDVEEIAVIGHYDCGMQGFEAAVLERKMVEKGIPGERIEFVKEQCGDLDAWFRGFDDAKDSVRNTVAMIRNHPLMPESVEVRGFLIDSRTGALEALPDEAQAHGGERPAA